MCECVLRRLTGKQDASTVSLNTAATRIFGAAVAGQSDSPRPPGPAADRVGCQKTPQSSHLRPLGQPSLCFLDWSRRPLHYILWVPGWLVLSCAELRRLKLEKPKTDAVIINSICFINSIVPLPSTFADCTSAEHGQAPNLMRTRETCWQSSVQPRGGKQIHMFHQENFVHLRNTRAPLASAPLHSRESIPLLCSHPVSSALRCPPVFLMSRAVSLCPFRRAEKSGVKP